MSEFNLPYSPSPYSNQTDVDLTGLESADIPDVDGVVRDLLVNEEQLHSSLRDLLEDLGVAQGIFDSYAEVHSEQETIELQEGFGRQCGIYANALFAISDIEKDLGLLSSAIEELNEYPGAPEELWQAVKGQEFAPLTGAFLGSATESFSGADGPAANIVLGAVTHVDQMVELVKKVNTWVDYTALAISRVQEAVDWLQAEVSRQQSEESEDSGGYHRAGEFGALPQLGY